MSRNKIPARYHREITECAREHNGPLYRFLFRFTRGDHALAEDLVQQVLIEAAVNWAELRMLAADEQTHRLYLIATRRAIDTFRKNRTARDYQAKTLPFSRQPDTDPHMHAVTVAAIERFVKVLESLPSRQALAATLRWRCGWKNCEIADALGISPSAVTQLLAKAKATLMRELRAYLPFELCGPEGGAQS